MRNEKYKQDIIPGVILALFSIAYLCLVPTITEFKGLGSTPLTNRFIPYLWGSALLILSLWVLVRGLLKRKRFLAEGGQIKKSSLKSVLMEYREVVASFVVLAIYVAIMKVVGFAISTTLYVFFQIQILTPKEKWKKARIPAVITAVLTGGLLFYIFRYLLNVLLPVGILSIFGL